MQNAAWVEARLLASYQHQTAQQTTQHTSAAPTNIQHCTNLLRLCTNLIEDQPRSRQ